MCIVKTFYEKGKTKFVRTLQIVKISMLKSFFKNYFLGWQKSKKNLK